MLLYLRPLRVAVVSTGLKIDQISVSNGVEVVKKGVHTLNSFLTHSSPLGYGKSLLEYPSQSSNL